MVMEVAWKVRRGAAPGWVAISTAVNAARVVVVDHFAAAEEIMGAALVGLLLELAAKLLSRPESQADPCGLYLIAEVYRYVCMHTCCSGRLLRKLTCYISYLVTKKDRYE